MPQVMQAQSLELHSQGGRYPDFMLGLNSYSYTQQTNQGGGLLELHSQGGRYPAQIPDARGTAAAPLTRRSLHGTDPYEPKCFNK